MRSIHTCCDETIAELRAELAELQMKLERASIPDPASAVPALVGALEKLLPLAESGRVHHGKFEDTQPIMDQARAALALAQGGKR